MSLRFGKLPVVTDYRTLRLGNYLTAQLPPAPQVYSTLDTAVAKLLGETPTDADIAKLFPMDANDKYGCCTIAGLSHAITVYRAKLGMQYVLPESFVTKLYFRLTGGVDTGLDMLNVLNFWRSRDPDPGQNDERIKAFVRVNPHNHDHITKAISLFGAVYVGFQCQENVESDFEKHIPWTPGRLTNDGHCVVAVGYDPAKVEVLTWGSKAYGTWQWWDECVEESYCLVPAEALIKGYSQLNSTQLIADLSQVAN